MLKIDDFYDCARVTSGFSEKPVLVVDDSKFQRQILVSLLSKFGQNSLQAASVDDALDLLRTQPVSMIISDWMMPGKTGLDLCKKVRETADDYTYFVLLTSKAGTDDIATGLDAGADDFLTKPVNGEELRARLTAGRRILDMQRDLREKNRTVARALNELKTLYHALDRDLVQARKLQHSLVQEPQGTFTSADVEVFLQSSGRIGGDLVGCFPITQDRLGLYAIDVSGHGVSSALLAARVAGFLSGASPDQNVALEKFGKGYRSIGPAKAVSNLNTLILEELDTELYFTMVLADADLSTGNITLCQAGHPHPAIVRSTGEVSFIGDGGMPVGLIEDAYYSEVLIDLAAGDRLLLYSDGITEACDPAGMFFGDDGLSKFLKYKRNDPVDGFFGDLVNYLDSFAGGPDLDDDISGILLEFKG